MKALLAACALAGFAGTASAGDLRQAEACAGIADNTARLACYDAAFGVGGAGGAGGATHPATRELDARVPPKVEFGDRGQLHGESQARAALPRRVDYKVSKVENLSGGLFRLTMDNGQVWVTRDSDWALDFKAGDEVTIQRMISGGFRVSHKGQGRNVTVARIS